VTFVSKEIIENLLKKQGIRPSRRLGQNFLVDKGVLKKIVETAEPSKDDIVLEVGAGIGNLTAELAKRVKKVIAVEKDQRIIEILKELLERWNIRNVKIVKGDIRKIENWKLKVGNCYNVVANIPYYLTSFLIRKFLEEKTPPKLMVLMVQKEVAQRIVAQPPEMSLLAVSVQFYATTKIISYISKKSFWPKPKVDSAIIKIIPARSPIQVSRLFRKRFFKVVRAGFSQPRKQLINNLSRGLGLDKKKVAVWLLKNKIKPSQRAETLNIEEWLNLTKSIKIILER
jgi:16S rRNA (adenine1518-N6/adenine1519-N6)-dimethyltransferase